jgi:hypothetical protein
VADNDPTNEADQLSDELAKKYDPERLLKMLSKRAGKGQSLDHSVRSKYEKRFGVDLGHVRIYSGEFAEEFNRQRNAYAVTISSTGAILMGGSPDRSMGSAAGQALLAHELTHVAQAKGGLHRSSRGGMEFAEEHEEEAEAVEADELSGGGGTDEHGHKQSPGIAAAMLEKARKEITEEAIDAIKKRVLEMASESANNQVRRNGGSARRP